MVAESTVEEMSSYMGLKFPASDIPKQVRNLYLRNSYCMIPDSNFIPVKLYPVINPATTALTDLSRSVPTVPPGAAIINSKKVQTLGIVPDEDDTEAASCLGQN